MHLLVDIWNVNFLVSNIQRMFKSRCLCEKRDPKWREMGSFIVLQDVTRVKCGRESYSETMARTKLRDVTSLMAVTQGRNKNPRRQIAQATKSSTVWTNICVFASYQFLGLQFWGWSQIFWKIAYPCCNILSFSCTHVTRLPFYAFCISGSFQDDYRGSHPLNSYVINKLIPWGRAILDTVACPQAGHLSLFWNRSIQSTPAQAISVRYLSILGDRGGVTQWLRCCATNRKVAVSIPPGVTGIFHWLKTLPIALWTWGRPSL